MSPIADFVLRLIVAGAGPIEAASVVAEAYAAGIAHGMSGGNPVDRTAERRRAYDRKRKSDKRKSGGLPPESTGLPVEVGGNVPLSILPSLTDSQGIQEVKQETKKEVLNTEPREKTKRGTRLPDDWQPSEADRKFAADRGVRDIDTEATKFRNYWTNRTDKQGTKPRWDRAWQNWILNVRGTNGKAPNGLSAALQSLKHHVGEIDRGEEGGQPPPRLLSHG